MNRKEWIADQMRKDAEIHARGYFNATERDTISDAANRMIVSAPAETSWIMEVIAEIAEAPAKSYSA